MRIIYTTKTILSIERDNSLNMTKSFHSFGQKNCSLRKIKKNIVKYKIRNNYLNNKKLIRPHLE